MQLAGTVLLANLLAFTCSGMVQPPTDAEYWHTEALQYLQAQLGRKVIKSPAKNIIFFLGDGMSIPTVTAARIYSGQLKGYSGEESILSFERFPWTGFSKTYCVDMQTADSACSATAYLGGVKANLGTIGVTAAVKVEDCNAESNITNHVASVLSWAQEAGKATGIVTTTRVTHASPAGTYAHTSNRDWESDADMQNSDQDSSECLDIAKQLITELPGKDINVILGGGRKKFLPIHVKDEEGTFGDRKDSTDLIKTWVADKQQRNLSYEYVWNKKELSAIDTNKTDYLLGLFSSSHMPYSLHASAKRPSLPLMVRKALEVLQHNPKGYFLFVEGGRIDHAHHDLQARRALHETVEFSETVQEAVNLVKEEDTLILVTADHAHTMSISGYPKRGSDILGLAGMSNKDNLMYSTISYANGPSNYIRHDLTHDFIGKDSYQFPAGVPMITETHGGDDVAIYGRGPWSHLLSGVMEQSTIPYIISFAACIGPNTHTCNVTKET